VATGRYSDIRETSATPQADSYDARFTSYTAPASAQTSFKFTQLRTQLGVALGVPSRVDAVHRLGARPARIRATRTSISRGGATTATCSRCIPDNTFLVKLGVLGGIDSAD
jgi:hypothetical protein